MRKIKDFFLFCAGVDSDILERCPSDENKYIGIGATVFFTGILAFVSSSYALYTVFDNVLISIAFGILWGLVIFNLDRYIVLSMKSRGSWFKNFMTAIPRLALAVLLSLVISKPLELKIFEKEINAEIIKMEQEVLKDQEDLVNERYITQIQNQQKEIEGLKREMQTKSALRDSLELMAIQEADGTGGSGKRNLGPIYKTKKAAADKAQTELENLQAEYLPLIREKEQSISALNRSIKDEINNLDRTAYGGFAARMDALSRLGKKSETIFLASIFITLLFISIETAPIMVKLISAKSPYDYLLHEHEHKFEMASMESIKLLENTTKNKIKYDTDLSTYKNNAQIQIEKEIIDAQLRARKEAQKNQALDWGIA